MATECYGSGRLRSGGFARLRSASGRRCFHAHSGKQVPQTRPCCPAHLIRYTRPRKTFVLLHEPVVGGARVRDAHESFHCIPDAYNRTGVLHLGEPLPVTWQLIRQLRPCHVHPVVAGLAPEHIDAGALLESALGEVENGSLRPIPPAAAGVPSGHANVVEQVANRSVQIPIRVRPHRLNGRNRCCRLGQREPHTVRVEGLQSRLSSAA